LFEQEFVRGVLYDHDELHNDTSDRVFHVLGIGRLEESCSQGIDEYVFEHTVFLNIERGLIDYTCQKLTKVGLLCSKCLRVMHICCVDKLLDRYIIKR